MKTINKALGDSKINERIVDMIIREVDSIEEDSAGKKVLVTSNDETIDMIKNGIREDIRKDVVFLKNQELTGGDLHIFSNRKIAFHGGVKFLIKYEHSQSGDEN
ncbi:hypothetical protein AA101099_2078 [Neoasaia chiangmaiensis NBRC 101099]|uniref:hypothetical protein n=1 Tax=Neoasaia chiangmaiensis TaxID=320497 RepID=UPI001197588D|nr:hypothetical protein [Neoasaia chiangmaiensis]GBR40364.1 hypothetical protein AA101099_2078 [Neoasaia chiangmaiensis NBRC 101099]GEN13934.1 hypothetical protein NCH01_03650 [Neoasaia chiangmaiensis]